MSHADDTLDIPVHWATFDEVDERPTARAIYDVRAYAMESDLRMRAHDDSVTDEERPLLERVPVVTVPASVSLSNLGLTAELRQLLASVDGLSSVRQILNATTQPIHEGVRAFNTLLRLGLVRLR